MRRDDGRGTGLRCGAGFRAFVALAVIAGFACDGGPHPGPPKTVATGKAMGRVTPSGPVLPYPRFTIRGRLPTPVALTYAIDSAGAALPPDTVHAAVTAAAEVWNATHWVRFIPAAPGAPAQVALSWQPSSHAGCLPFLPSEGTVAHTGPLETPTFVHFDRETQWSPRGGDGTVGVFQAALHELGHVLGIAHAPDASAVMGGGYDSARRALTPADRAAVASLYAPRTRWTDDDLVPCRFDRTGMPIPGPWHLVGIAPPDLRAFTVLDVDGDGRDDVVTWSKEDDPVQEMMAFRLDAALAVDRSFGPFAGPFVAGRRNWMGRTMPEGVAVMVQATPDGRYVALRFSAFGIPQLPWSGGSPLYLEGGVSDADGDGRLDTMDPAPRMPPVEVLTALGVTDGFEEVGRGDVDGDGFGDVLVATPLDPDAARAFRWVRGGPDGSWSALATFRGRELRLGDLDGDGRRGEAMTRGLISSAAGAGR